MDREIIFIGKRKSDEEWIEGCLLSDEKAPEIRYIGYLSGVEDGVVHDVDVDEKELLRALNYDRGQYEKGFSDGAQWASQKEIPRKPMVHNKDGYEEFARCECGAVLVTTYGNRHKYCSNCGRKVDWSGEDD